MMGVQGIPIIAKRCPKCRGAPTAFIEMWSGFSMHFDGRGTNDFQMDYRSDKGILVEGAPSGVVFAICGRGHRWRLRGVHQITDLDVKRR